jgi:hypothetical protein
MENRTKITADQLKYLTQDCRELIAEYIQENNYSNNRASIELGVHPNQLLLFMKKDQGFNIKTIQKIGSVIADHKINSNGNLE